MAARTDSITIHDVIKFLQGFDAKDRFLTVIEKEDGFSFICSLILPLIFRHASQSRHPSHGNSLQRIQRIQKIAAVEGIFPELSSSPNHATLSKGPLSSEQSASPDHSESPEHNTSLGDILSPERDSTPGRNRNPEHDTTPKDTLSPERGLMPERNRSPEHDTTPEDTISPERRSTPDRNKSHEHNTTPEDILSLRSSTPDRHERPEFNTTLGDTLSPEQSSTPDRRNGTKESTLSQQNPLIADNALCVGLSSLPADASTPTTLMIETVPFQDSAIELSDSEAEKDPLSSSSPPAEGPTKQGHITPGDPETTANLIPITEDQDKEETPDFTTLDSTITVSLNFPFWSDSPESFWNNSYEASVHQNHDLITIPKVFIKDALDKKSNRDVQKVQDRFYSILTYKIFERMMETRVISSAKIRQFLDNLGLPSDSKSHSFCSRLLHGGRRRIDFCRRVTPDAHKIDYGLLLIPELQDETWEQSNTRVRDRCTASVALFKSQNLSSWSKSSGAQSAANSIISSRQPLLDYFQAQRDIIQGQKRRADYTESLSSKRIRSDPISQPPLQTSSPILVHDAQVSCGNSQAAYDNVNQLNLSMRVDEPALIPSVVSHNIYQPSATDSSSNWHNGTPIEVSGYNGTQSTLFEGMGYPDLYFSGLGYEGEDSYDENLYSQLLYFAQQDQ